MLPYKGTHLKAIHSRLKKRVIYGKEKEIVLEVLLSDHLLTLSLAVDLPMKNHRRVNASRTVLPLNLQYNLVVPHTYHHHI
jgi:hypothetical protein